MTSSAPLALTMGEPGGIGPEITAKAWEALKSTGPQFFLVGDASLAGTFGPVAQIDCPTKAAESFKNALPVMDIGKAGTVHVGEARPETAIKVIEAIERAVQLSLTGQAGGVVTNPIQKSVLLAAGFGFPGHTEFLGELTSDDALPAETRGPVMMLAGPELRTVPVTIHQSVISAAQSLSTETIIHTARVTAHALRQDFGIATPRLAISGLNPHAGEDGRLGQEDRETIAPAVRAIKDMKIDAVGPLPADAMFHSEARKTYNAALCMLHDQALIPVKTLAFDQAVNVTLGLPIIRTSPDHGTALDIAGQNIARADSLIASIRLAAELAERRAS